MYVLFTLFIPMVTMSVKYTTCYGFDREYDGEIPTTTNNNKKEISETRKKKREMCTIDNHFQMIRFK